MDGPLWEVLHAKAAPGLVENVKRLVADARPDSDAYLNGPVRTGEWHSR